MSTQEIKHVSQWKYMIILSVLNRWACYYKELYKGCGTNEFDVDFYDYAPVQIMWLEAAWVKVI